MGRALGEALAAGQKVAMPIAAFALLGCCVLVGGGLLVYASAGGASSTALLLPPPGASNGGLLRGEAEAKCLGFVLAMAALLAWAAWLHGHVAQKRQALRQIQIHQQQQQGMVRSPGPMGA